MHKVIYDTDPGVDDAMALVFQALHPDIALLGVTSVFGNSTIETTTRNALYLGERFAPGVPVANGAASARRCSVRYARPRRSFRCSRPGRPQTFA